ncbi:nicotinamide N-methyltransferase [Sarracenia purpurea var. burkii]
MVDFCCDNYPTILCIADLGCSSGENTFYIVSEIIETVHKTCKQLGHQTPEFQVYLNDLPGNDFNTIFKSWPSFQEHMRKKMDLNFGNCFFAGIPGSFYGRLFQNKSLHFIHSSYGLMWLSQIRKIIREGNGFEMGLSKKRGRIMSGR